MYLRNTNKSFVLKIFTFSTVLVYWIFKLAPRHHIASVFMMHEYDYY